jgi:hypothetical protein
VARPRHPCRPAAPPASCSATPASSPACPPLLLRSDGGEAAENVPVAVPIRVQGDVISGIASYCQQGTPLLVRTVTRR